MVSQNLAQTKQASSILFWPIVLASLGFGILMFLLPIYAHRLESTALQIGGLYSAFSITTLVARPLVGWGLDRYGRKMFLVAAILGYAAALSVFSVASSLIWMYVARVIQGIASSLMWLTAYTIAADLAPASGRGRSIAIVDAASAQGSIFGAIPGLILISRLPLETAWPILFGGFALAALCGAWLAWRRVPETKPVVSLEKQVQQPISLGLKKLMVVVFFTGIGLAMVMPIWLVFLQDNITTEVSQIALAYLPAALVYGFLPARMGHLSDKWGRVLPIALGLSMAALVSLLLPSMVQLTNGLFVLSVLWVFEALGFVAATPAQEALVADLTGIEMRGRAYGFYTLAAGLGATVGPLLGGWLYDNSGQSVPFYINGILMALSALLVVILFRKKSSGI